MEYIIKYLEWIEPFGKYEIIPYFIGFFVPVFLIIMALGKLLKITAPAWLFKYGVVTYKQGSENTTDPKHINWNAEEEINDLSPKCVIKYSSDEILVVNDELKQFEVLMALHFMKIEGGLRIDVIVKRTIPGILLHGFFFLGIYFALLRALLKMFSSANVIIIYVALTMVLLIVVGRVVYEISRFDKGLCEVVSKAFKEKDGK